MQKVPTELRQPLSISPPTDNVRNQMSAPLLNLSADNPISLVAALRRIDITVPHITEGRTLQHRERYLMAGFVATEAGSKLLHYPLTVEHRDKPDFVLQMGDVPIGIECVEAVPKEWYEIEAIRERKYPDALNWGHRFKPGEKVFSLKEKEEIASGSLAGPPWVGDMAERQWAEALEYFIRLKTDKLRAGNYREFSKMWLLIQDEWRVPLYNYEDIKKAAIFCLSRIRDLRVEPCFSSIFVCSGRWLLSLGSNEVTMKPIRDIWSDD